MAFWEYTRNREDDEYPVGPEIDVNGTPVQVEIQTKASDEIRNNFIADPDTFTFSPYLTWPLPEQ